MRGTGGGSAKRLPLPPLWAMVGSCILALVVALGMMAGSGGEVLGVWFLAVAAALPPLTAVVWAIDKRPGWLSWRRASVTFSAGATFSVLLALLLEILVPYVLFWVLLDVGTPVIRALEDLLDLFIDGQVARTLTSSGFLLAVFELAVVAPLIEELAKSLVVLPLLKGLQSWRDAFLLGAVAGAGFAAMENVVYALFGGQYWAGILAVRALGAAVHPLCSGLAAVAWHGVLNRESSDQRGWIGGFGAAVGLHGLWNGGLVVWLALAGTAITGPGTWTTNVLGYGVAAGLLALIALEGTALAWGMRALSRRLSGAEPPMPVPWEDVPPERAVAVWAVVCLLVLLPVGLAMMGGR